MTVHQPPGGQPLRSIDALVEAGLAAPERREALQAVAERYAVSVTSAIAALVDPADAADPIARQFIPSAAELLTLPQELADPIGDDAHSPVEGVVLVRQGAQVPQHGGLGPVPMKGRMGHELGTPSQFGGDRWTGRCGGGGTPLGDPECRQHRIHVRRGGGL